MIDLKNFEAECRFDIPLLNAMQLSFVSFEDLTLTMEAPLAPNINNIWREHRQHLPVRRLGRVDARLH
jgi:hypothetical protein